MVRHDSDWTVVIAFEHSSWMGSMIPPHLVTVSCLFKVRPRQAQQFTAAVAIAEYCCTHPSPARFARRRGTVITRLDVYRDYQSFFQKHPSGVLPGSNGEERIVPSAVLLVGYNNQEGVVPVV